jgi:hypothetical protein
LLLGLFPSLEQTRQHIDHEHREALTRFAKYTAPTILAVLMSVADEASCRPKAGLREFFSRVHHLRRAYLICANKGGTFALSIHRAKAVFW